jgi:enterochelin esterase-like enzyme
VIREGEVTLNEGSLDKDVCCLPVTCGVPRVQQTCDMPHVTCNTPRMTLGITPSPQPSPRVAALQQAIEAGDQSALDTFWQEIVAQGAPLVEPIAEDDDHVLLTFLWRAAEPIDHVLLFDGQACIDLLDVPTVLDNLLAESRIPSLVVVMVDNPDRETRNRELPCHQPFADFLARELLPWARARYHVTDDPARTIVGGQSYGGLAATFAGLRYPEVFGNVLSQSGSFWWKPDGDEEHEWLTRQFVDSPALPLRFYLDVGLLENSYEEGPSQRCTNRHMRDILRAKGYPVHYVEYNGGHDYVWWRGTLADGLLALVGK